MGKWFGSGWFGGNSPNISRREFLRRAATLGAAAATTNPLEALLDAVPTPAPAWPGIANMLSPDLYDGFEGQGLRINHLWGDADAEFAGDVYGMNAATVADLQAAMREARDRLHLADPDIPSRYNFLTKQWHAPVWVPVPNEPNSYQLHYMEAGHRTPDEYLRGDDELSFVDAKEILANRQWEGTITQPGKPIYKYTGTRKDPRKVLHRGAVDQIEGLKQDWIVAKREQIAELASQKELTPEQRAQLQQYNAELGRYPSNRNDNIPPTLLERGLLNEFDAIQFDPPPDEFLRGAPPRRLKNPRQPPTGPGPGALSSLMDEQEMMYG